MPPQTAAAKDQPDPLMQRYQALLDVADVIHACRDLDELFRKLAGLLHGLFAFDSIAVGLVEPDGVTLKLGLFESWIKQEVSAGFTIPLRGIPAGWVIENQQPLHVRTADGDPRFPLHNEKLAQSGLRVSYHLPLTTSLTRLGELAFAFRDDAVDLPESEVQFMMRVADQVAVAIENARNFEGVQRAHVELEHHNKQRELLLQLTNSVASNLDLKDLLNAVVRDVRKVVPCALAVVALPDETRQNLQIRAIDFPKGKGLVHEGLTIPVEGSMGGRVFKGQQRVVVNELEPKNYSPEMFRRVSGEGLRANCFVPLVSRGRSLGILVVGRTEPGGFSEADAEFLDLVANQITIALENALAYQEIAKLRDQLAQEKLYLEEEIRSERSFDEIIGQSEALRKVLQHVETVASADATVLILGETGTGKELIARAIHDSSRRKGHTFVKLNCAAIPTGLLESELFGHEKGAFTGAIAQKIGRMELANGGTLFLDEVGDIPLELQPKLLRALQEREFERLGSVRTQKADVRFLAATNRDLPKMVTEKQFRSDLFYRLNVFPITIPALRERRDDIPRLVRYFVSKYAKKMDKRIETIPADVMARLQAWSWPGNVRELENIIERSVILTRDAVLRVPLAELGPLEMPDAPPSSLRDNERDLILKVLREARGTLSGANGAAARLGLKRTTLQSKMKKLGIAREHYS